MFENEKKFLLLVAMPVVDESQKQEIVRLFQENINFDYVYRQLILNKISNLAFQNLRETRILGRIPKLYRRNMEDVFTASSLRYEKYISIAKQAAQLFEQNRLTYAFLKGINLQNKIYRHCSMFVRDFSDLDILIDPTDEALFISVMGKMGFREGKYDMYSEAFSPSTRSDVLKGKMFYHQIPPFCKKISPYYSYANAVFLDVNFYPFFGGQIKDPIEISEFMKNVCRTPYYNENFTYLSLRDEYDLLQNCFHFYKDMLYAPRKTMRDIYKIISFLDIREFIRNHRATLNWDKFSQLVSSNGLNESVYIVLYLTEQLFHDLQVDTLIQEFKPASPSASVKELLCADIDDLVFNK